MSGMDEEKHQRTVKDALSQIKMFKKTEKTDPQKLDEKVKMIMLTLKERAKPIVAQGMVTPEQFTNLKQFLVQQALFEFSKLSKDELEYFAAVMTMHQMMNQ